MKQLSSRRGRFSQGGRNQSAPFQPEPTQQSAPFSREQVRLRKWVAQTKFKRALFGGVQESDVWKKIGELNELYEAALIAERARYDALLAEWTGEAPDEEV